MRGPYHHWVPGPVSVRFMCDMDDDGHIWIHLTKLGITMLAESPEQQPGTGSVLRVREPTVLEGPCVREVPVCCATRTAPEGAWVQNDHWPGVHVVEGPLVSGSTNIVVAVDPGARAVISGPRVP